MLVLVLGVILVIVILIAAAVVVGGLGLRRALKKGRYCPRCGLWGTELEISVHQELDHKQE